MGLTIAQLQAYAAAAGFPDPVTAAAIAMAESSGNPSAVGDQALAPTNGPSIGLWQINIGSNANANFANQPLTDPQTNANAAFAIFSAAGGFTPWTTFTNGAYSAYLTSPTLTPPASTFAPATGILNLLPGVTATPQPVVGAIDWTTISIVGVLALGVLFAFSEA
jgi:hypothetical protein